MNIEIRKTFEKDSAKLPLDIQLKLSEIIETDIKSGKLSEIPSCKKMQATKMITE